MLQPLRTVMYFIAIVAINKNREEYHDKFVVSGVIIPYFSCRCQSKIAAVLYHIKECI